MSTAEQIFSKLLFAEMQEGGGECTIALDVMTSLNGGGEGRRNKWVMGESPKGGLERGTCLRDFLFMNSHNPGPRRALGEVKSDRFG